MRSKPMSILRLATYATLALGAFVSLLPLVTVLLASFKDVKEFGLSGALDLPKSWLYLQNYATAWTKAKMPLAFWNTSLILFFTLIGSVITGTMVAYIINRFSFKGRNLVKAAFLVANLIPGVTMQVSTYQIMKIGRASCRERV